MRRKDALLVWHKVQVVHHHVTLFDVGDGRPSQQVLSEGKDANEYVRHVSIPTL
jgi:hypothetical protein